jgi:NADPH-dependent 2,4-dienoyl-CoA reductase/sulfur reductase-like enzyme
MTESCALAVIGGGPAGLAAAATAAELGLQVTLIDEQSTPGGQIFRGIENADKAISAILGQDYGRGTALIQSFRKSGATYRARSDVWVVTPERDVGVVSSGVARMIEAERIIVATGSMERAVPFPGWTLPGVMTVGAGQILLKQEGMVPNAGIVLAGIGPLLLLVACQYLRAGVAIQALLDMTPMSNYLHALPHLPMALTAGDYIAKGKALKRELNQAGVPIVAGVRNLAAYGDGSLGRVEFDVGDHRRRLETGLLMVHFGVVPNGHLAASLGVAEFWDQGQRCWRPSIDAWGNTGVDGIALAGDCAGIAGANAAEHSGRLAAFEAGYELGRIDRVGRDRLAAPVRRAMGRDLRIRPFLEALFRPPASLLGQIGDDTLVCRCEEVTAGRVREAAALGCQGPNQVKAFTRAGMGPCQGRQCGATVAHVVAEARGIAVETVGHFRVRSPVKPITLGAVASLDVDDVNTV